MGVYINKARQGVTYEGLFEDCLLILEEPHKAGDIINDRIILSESMWFKEPVPTEEEIDAMVYDKGYAVRAVNVELIDDIITCTDLTPYGFTKVDDNRYCFSNEAIYWAQGEVYVNKLPKHRPLDKELEFWMD
jgi:hypothetical protein